MNLTKMRTLRVYARSAAAPRGILALGTAHFPCALGKGGSRAIKREGDGTSPRGLWPVRFIYYRADKGPRPRTGLPIRQLRPGDGWCDAAGDRNYNRAVSHPYAASAERLWRADNLYDIIVVLGHNDVPRRRGMGSAIFIHLVREGFQPTEGCIALREQDLRRVLRHIGPGTSIRIG